MLNPREREEAKGFQNMKTMKTWLATIAVLLCSTTVSAYDFEVDGIYYNILSAAERTVEVTSGTTTYEGDIVIPSIVKYNNLDFSVTAIGTSAFLMSGITSIILPHSLTSIGESAFFNCNITSITLPESLKSIGKDAFNGCAYLTSINIPEGITSIPDNAFSSCFRLETIQISQNVTSIGNGAFLFCSKLKPFDPPTNLRTIGSDAFNGCENMTYFKYTNGGFNIDINSFRNSIKIMSVPAWICPGIDTTTPPSAYFDLNEVVFILPYEEMMADFDGDGIEESLIYSDYGFHVSGHWEDANILLYDPAFTDTEIDYLLETGGRVTQNGVIYQVASLRNSFTMRVHGYEEGITTADIASKITYLNREFTVTSIKGSAFANATSLTTVKIPSTITSIGTDAFVGCTAITSVTTERTTPLTINDGCFDAMTQLFVTLYVPTGSLSAYQTADVWKGFGTITEAGVSSNTLTLKANEGGTIACGSASVNNGTEYASITSNSATITFTPNTYYTLTKVLVDGTDVTSQVTNGELTISITADTKVEATFNAENEIILSDEQESFELSNNLSCNSITYTRTLPNLHWNALYLPFEIPVSQLAENYDVAYFNDVHSYDDDNDGKIDEMEMEVIKLTSGTLKANYPYLIRAKNEAAKELSITVENATLHKTEQTTVTCSSVFMKFDITGTYSQMTADELDGSLVITTDGAWKQLSATSTLKPFRLYLTLTTLDGSPVKVEETFAVNSPMVTIRVRGEEPGTTSIDCEEIRVKSEESDTPIYNLMGQPVKNPVKGSIYIQGGRKVIW